MKNFSISRLAEIILTRRKQFHLTQQQLADLAGINRSMLCHLENQEYVPSMDQLTRLANSLKFDVTDVFIEYNPPVFHRVTPRKIAVYGAGTAGLSVATLLARQHQVTLTDSLPDKVEQINRRSGPFEDEYVEKYFLGSNLNLAATVDGEFACKQADFAVIALPTGYSARTNRFNTTDVESTIETILESNPQTVIVIRSRVPVGFTAAVREKYHFDNILVSPDFSRESKSLYDNLYPARIVVGCDEATREAAQVFAGMLKNSTLKKDVEVLLTGLDEAESIRLFSDAFLAVRRTCINELDSFAESRNLNVREIIQGVCLDPRIGNHDCNPTFGDESRGLPENMDQVIADSGTIPRFMLAAVAESGRMRMDHIAAGVFRLADVSPDDSSRILSGEKRLTVGIYRVTGISGSGSIRNNAIQEIMIRLRARGAGFVIYEPALEDGSVFFGGKVVNHLKRFKKQSDVILADRYNSSLDDVKDKVYTRDLSFSNEPEW